MAKKWCLIGMADDAGVHNVGGRPGAGRGPMTFREFFYKMKGRKPVQDNLEDLGDTPVSEELAKTHEQATAFIAKQHPAHLFSLIIGGGHDLVYPHLRGIKEGLQLSGTLGCINIDPHYDLRKDEPVFTSGSPFYAALKTGLLQPRNLVEFGIQDQSNTAELHAYAEAEGVNVIWFENLRIQNTADVFEEELRKLAAVTDAIVLSLDLDALQAAFAPGVSAPAAEGFTPTEVIQMIRIAALEPKVVSLGIYELNPDFDQDFRTARLAATIAWHFADTRLKAMAVL
ncbi:MAG: formimidoylglutamase [Hymenobacteraceae bacterium]|nr:formimidoylglutamase [Hymenobacteraceae bacterium]MDX5395917.1 formimidoylglutamase [Hymenobacteraceae bacterium]MDX5442686.1 formimidoylglutamase [Hymenobacteraceae bacterium]MDX5511974.1 formimidoylglutamase [Hymenobacteraceae bacterium]